MSNNGWSSLSEFMLLAERRDLNSQTEPHT